MRACVRACARGGGGGGGDLLQAAKSLLKAGITGIDPRQGGQHGCHVVCVPQQLPDGAVTVRPGTSVRLHGSKAQDVTVWTLGTCLLAEHRTLTE